MRWRLAVALLTLCLGCSPAVRSADDLRPSLVAAPTWPPAEASAMGLPVFPSCPTFTWQLIHYNLYLSTVSPSDPGVLVGTIPIQPSPTPTYTWTCSTPLADGTYYLNLTLVDAVGTEGGHNVGTGFVVGSPSPPPAVIGINSPIFVNTAVGVALNVRAAPGGTIIGTQARGATGVVTGGPTIIGSVTWWQITYTNAPSGWSSGTYLSLTAP